MRTAKTVVTVLAIAIAAPSSAQVDSFSGPLSPGNFWSTMQMDPLSQHLRQEQDRMQARNGAATTANGGAAKKSPTPAAPDIASPTLRYTPSLERRRANFDSFVAKTRAADPAGADGLKTLFASRDLIAELSTGVAQYGLRVDNLADAYTIWWVNCWQAVHGDFTASDRATAQAVRAQAARALLSTGKLANATDAAKQEFAEALLIQGVLVDAALQQAKGKPDELKAVSTAANQGAKGMGLDMTVMTLTPKGFVPKS